jgi:hypothetical protein
MLMTSTKNSFTELIINFSSIHPTLDTGPFLIGLVLKEYIFKVHFCFGIFFVSSVFGGLHSLFSGIGSLYSSRWPGTLNPMPQTLQSRDY